MRLSFQHRQIHLEQLAKLDRKFALKLNEYLERLEQIFLSYSMMEQGQGRIGIQSFLKFIRFFEIVEKDCFSNKSKKEKEKEIAIDMTSV